MDDHSNELVLLMFISGTALFMVVWCARSNNLLSIRRTDGIHRGSSQSDTGKPSVIPVVFSTEYADSGNPLACVIGGFDKCFLHGIGLDAIMPTGIPELTFAMFQCMFSLITPALILGAFAERVKFSGYWQLFTILWVIIA